MQMRDDKTGATISVGASNTSGLRTSGEENSSGLVSTNFDAFYDFAFPRVYRFAFNATRDSRRARAMCRLILERAVTTPPLSKGRAHGEGSALGSEAMRREALPVEEVGFWLYGIARRVANEVAADPSRLDKLSKDLYSDPALEAPDAQDA